jgi:hypothetical protein
MDDVDAISQLETWKKFNLHWTEHQPSVTVTIDEKEWMEVGSWCYANFDILGGVSFLPKADDAHTYVEAPYERCTPADLKTYPKVEDVKWDEVPESVDKEMEWACSSGQCEI